VLGTHHPITKKLIIPLLKSKAQDGGFDHYALDLFNALTPSESSRVPSNSDTLPVVPSILKSLNFRQLVALLFKSDGGGVHLSNTNAKSLMDKLSEDVEKLSCSQY